ncbi:MAG: hypothetical protein V2I33_15040, partial [Kangiellaceae bacterium]|nr:hypothetical protein [Kangiellaceae bacterium]
MKKIIQSLVLSLAASSSFIGANAAEQVDLDALLKKLEQGSYQQSQQNRQREQAFKQQAAQQQALLNQAQAEKAAIIKESERLEKINRDYDAEIAKLDNALTERLGSLKELFGVLQGVAGDTRSKIESSIVSVQLPNRGDFLGNLAKEMGTSSKLASIEEIERVWFEMQREIIESGKVTRFTTEVIPEQGPKQQQEVIRVGVFNLISNGKYLEYDEQSGAIVTLPAQPSSRFTATAEELQNAKGELVGFAMDPTRGSILDLQTEKATTEEQVHQGGIPGYIIL